MARLNVHDFPLGRLTVVLLVVGGVLALSVAGAIDFWVIQSYVVKNAGEDSTLLAQELLHAVNRKVENRLEGVKLAFSEPDIWDILSAASSSATLSEADRTTIDRKVQATEAYFTATYGKSLISHLAVTNVVGQELGLESGSAATETWWKETQAHGTYVGPVYEDAQQNSEALTFGVQIQNAAGVVVGSLTGELSLYEVADELAHLQSNPAGYWINPANLKQDQDYVLLTNDGRVMYATEPKAPLTAYAADIFQQMNTGQKAGQLTGYFRTHEDFQKDKPVLLAYAYSAPQTGEATTGWSVVIEHPISAILLQAFQIGASDLGVMLLGLLLTALCLWFCIRALIIRPLARLSAATRLVKADSGPLPIQPLGNNEIGQLTEGFVRMTKTLSTHAQKTLRLNEELKLVGKTVRHDITNRLIYILYNVTDIQQHEPVSPAVKEKLESIGSAARASMDFVQQMKKFEGVGLSSLRAYDMREVVQKCLRECVQTLKVTCTGDGKVLADDMIYPIISNLFQNAQLHGKVDRLTVTITPTAAGVTVRLADTGLGIPDEVKPHIFTEGFTYGETGHTGIGLYVVRMTMERYGGTITLEDNQPHGCVFTLQFPRVSSPVK